MKIFNAVLAAVLFVSATAVAEEPDRCWGVQGRWDTTQVSGGNTLKGVFTLYQSGQTVTGTAKWDGIDQATVTGKVEGGVVHLTLHYPGTMEGYYDAHLTGDDRALSDGTTHGNQGGQATWTGTKTGCLSAEGCWQVTQSGGATGVWTVRQDGAALSGVAKFNGLDAATITGTIDGHHANMTFAYPANLIGYYEGDLADDGFSFGNGTTHSNQGGQATWTAVQGTCAQAVTGCWQVKQFGNGNDATGVWHLSQAARAVSGEAKWKGMKPAAVTGRVRGSRVNLTFTYDGGMIGYYEGFLADDGKSFVNGVTHSNSGAQANWTATQSSCDKKGH